MFSISKEAYLNLLVQGGQMYRAFHFSKGFKHSQTCKTYYGTARFLLSLIVEDTKGTTKRVLQCH